PPDFRKDFLCNIFCVFRVPGELQADAIDKRLVLHEQLFKARLSDKGLGGSHLRGERACIQTVCLSAARERQPHWLLPLPPVCLRYTRSEEHTSELQSPDHLVFRIM